MSQKRPSVAARAPAHEDAVRPGPLSDLVRRAETSQQDPIEEPGPAALANVARHLAVDDPWRDAVDADPARRQFHGHRAGEALQQSLRIVPAANGCFLVPALP